VEVFSLLVDTDHRDFGATVRYDRRLGGHELLVGLNYGKGSVEGGNYRNLNGQPNGISEYVDNRADSVEAFVVDHWHAGGRLTLVIGGQLVSAWRDVLTTNAITGAVSNPADRFTSFNRRVPA
jgi:iron complex outermembrane receptor protein